jgi:hypothetical protein
MFCRFIFDKFYVAVIQCDKKLTAAGATRYRSIARRTHVALCSPRHGAIQTISRARWNIRKSDIKVLHAHLHKWRYQIEWKIILYQFARLLIFLFACLLVSLLVFTLELFVRLLTCLLVSLLVDCVFANLHLCLFACLHVCFLVCLLICLLACHYFVCLFICNCLLNLSNP